MYDITFKGLTPSNFNAWLATIPVITPSESIRTRQNVPAMDGTLLLMDTAYADATITFTLHTKRNDLNAKMRQLRQWMSGTGKLKISDSTDSYYEVKETKLTIVKKDETYGRLIVEMKVYPYEFLESGDTDITSYSTVQNTAEPSKPIYKIVGNGSGKLTVNGNEMTFTVTTADNGLFIDTRRMIAYNAAGQGRDGVINGEYEGLWLNTGNNSISCTAGTLTLKPKWGYRV